MLLVCADVIRPSLGWLLSPGHPGWPFRRNGPRPRPGRVRRPGRDLPGGPRQQPHHAAGAAPHRGHPSSQGGQVADITIGDCLELLQIAGDLLRSSDSTSPYFYQLLRAAGVFGAAAPPGQALKTQGQLSCEQLIDRYAIACRPVRGPGR